MGAVAVGTEADQVTGAATGTLYAMANATSHGVAYTILRDALRGWTFADFAPKVRPIDKEEERRNRCPRASMSDRNIHYHGNKLIMEINLQLCSRARLSRDARFDGKFFIGVLTSGVYCRPICPARTAKESNVRYFPSAAAAAEAGFRPCLRCRPECSPGTPAWIGSQTTISRALRLISERGLEEERMEGLADRLGIGARHLRRLFVKHLGATPSAVVQTRRLQFAKKLIDETSLPMCQVATASGFGSVRRFNAAIRKVYHRTPTHIRRLSRQDPVETADQYRFVLRYRPPYHWAGMLSFLAARAIPGVEAVESETYRRSISLNGSDGCFEVAHDPSRNSLRVCIEFPEPRSLFQIVERIRAIFDLNADWNEIARHLKRDPALRSHMELSRGMRVPGCWDGFELAVRAVLGQQITVRAATTLAGRIAATFGKPLSIAQGITHLFPTAPRLATADLTCVGLTRARAETVRSLAQAICNRQLSFEGITHSERFLSEFQEISGIGPWTAQYVAMRALREPDAFPFGDLALLNALSMRNATQLERRSQAWRPWRAYAAMLLWNSGKRQGAATASPRPRADSSAIAPPGRASMFA